MKNIQLVIPDLFLPNGIAAEACQGLKVPSLEKLLGRGSQEFLPPVSMEHLLCESFGLSCQPDIPVAPISAVYDGLVAGDGLAEGCWMRADPVHLQLQRTHLLANEVQASAEEAKAICISLNEHFAGQGIEFHAPHPQRWYVRLKTLPQMRSTPLSQVIGNDVRMFLPAGEDASRWHQVFNEIQMLLFAHPLNEARESRGELPVNSVWFWGGGCSPTLLNAKLRCVCSDDVLAEMFARASGIPFSSFQTEWNIDQGDGRQLLVWTGLRTALQQGGIAAWHDSLEEFEKKCALPVWHVLRSGRIESVQMDIPGIENLWRFSISRRDTWAVWRRIKLLASYSMV